MDLPIEFHHREDKIDSLFILVIFALPVLFQLSYNFQLTQAEFYLLYVDVKVFFWTRPENSPKLFQLYFIIVFLFNFKTVASFRNILRKSKSWVDSIWF